MRLFKGILTFFSTFIAVALIFSSCSEKKEIGPAFTVKGNICNGADKNIGIYHISEGGAKKIEQKKLDKAGNYEFRISRPEHFDFYLLNLEGSGTIVFIADSTETITINSNADDFIQAYTVDGNDENQRIKEILLLRDALEEQVKTLASSTSPAVVKTEREIKALVEEFKENIIAQYIVPSPGSASAYYALTLTLAEMPIFNPMVDKRDSRCFAAVATNFQHQHPGTRHTKRITEIAEEGLKATRKPRQVELEVEEKEATITDAFDIKLPQANGDSIALSSMAGKVILLDFTAYENTELSSRNIMMRELYNKYNKKGFEIFQISFDRREHFWQQSANNLPWTCVRDASGTSASLYYIQALPTFFLINRKGEVVLRDAQIEDIEKEIEKLLKNQ
ncbi:MAG: AhpC/TSA family protein [Bacteroidaceae bacterium]|nr:AhpC/TSA family protein [Bacteroidaceae bacterium]